MTRVHAEVIPAIAEQEILAIAAGVTHANVAGATHVIVVGQIRATVAGVIHASVGVIAAELISSMQATNNTHYLCCESIDLVLQFFICNFYIILQIGCAIANSKVVR